ncbi:hypothetical protein NPIL_415721 [Nephila pilipes]|uniref:Uncharacterized protein n=1 Tax=Nephila pilipes TaxID=299642 RepID=A0A8X6TTI1_NEPPI|nr:hypothetical protein NPIL_415721 [Nephila pilipes]
MWMAIAFSCLILITRTLNNPVDNQRIPSDAMDEFYQKLISTFDKFLAPDAANRDGSSKTRSLPNDVIYSTSEKLPMAESTGSERKLKRDETAAESHLEEMEINPE